MIIANNISETIKGHYDVVVVGAGLSGAVIAERFASQSNKKVLVVEKRNHIAGNCYDYIDENGILVNEYGAHLFHTNHEDVWSYVQQFEVWKRWDHRVLCSVDGKIVNIPVNINTVNALCGTHIMNDAEMQQWLNEVQIKYDVCHNSEEVAKSRVGEYLYEKLFKHYTFKQWNRYPSELDPLVLSRIPVRSDFNDRYFDDRYQALPEKGYTKFVESVLAHPNITTIINCDYFEIKDNIASGILIFTGQIDQYFSNRGLDKLEYRSIDFTVERYKNMNYYQINSVVNYSDRDVPFTRIVEYKHFLTQPSPHTTIVKEVTKDSGEPYYPIPDKRNIELYGKYAELAKVEESTFFIGRLANYKYFNMDQAIKNSLDYYSTIESRCND